MKKSIEKPKTSNEQPKSNYKYEPCERETLILWSDADTDCSIYTCNQSLIRQLKSKGYQVVTSDANSTTFACSKRNISFRTISTEKPKRKPMSEEHKAKLQAAREQRKSIV